MESPDRPSGYSGAKFEDGDTHSEWSWYGWPVSIVRQVRTDLGNVILPALWKETRMEMTPPITDDRLAELIGETSVPRGPFWADVNSVLLAEQARREAERKLMTGFSSEDLAEMRETK